MGISLAPQVPIWVYGDLNPHTKSPNERGSTVIYGGAHHHGSALLPQASAQADGGKAAARAVWAADATWNPAAATAGHADRHAQSSGASFHEKMHAQACMQGWTDRHLCRGTHAALYLGVHRQPQTTLFAIPSPPCSC
eukprot:365313-Chlamydomonas_euryale.AAC.1